VKKTTIAVNSPVVALQPLDVTLTKAGVDALKVKRDCETETVRVLAIGLDATDMRGLRVEWPQTTPSTVSRMQSATSTRVAAAVVERAGSAPPSGMIAKSAAVPASFA
jgi:hypothetical protein